MTPYLILVASVILVAAAVVALAWLRRRLRVVTVIGDSMRPTLAPGDQLLVKRIPLAQVQTGDIVVLSTPHEFRYGQQPEDQPWLIKRAIATSGDPVPASVAPALSVRPGSPVRDGVLIVIGDNRDASFDSRVFGYVAAEDLLGVVLRRINLNPRRRPASPTDHLTYHPTSDLADQLTDHPVDRPTTWLPADTTLLQPGRNFAGPR